MKFNVTVLKSGVEILLMILMTLNNSEGMLYKCK